MEYLLILTMWSSQPFSYDVTRYEVKSTVECQQMGSQLAKELLSKIPGISHVHYECIEKRYGVKKVLPDQGASGAGSKKKEKK